MFASWPSSWDRMNIRVNAISAGPIRDDLLARRLRLLAGHGERITGSAHRYCAPSRPREVGDSALFLCSETGLAASPAKSCYVDAGYNIMSPSQPPVKGTFRFFLHLF